MGTIILNLSFVASSSVSIQLMSPASGDSLQATLVLAVKIVSIQLMSPASGDQLEYLYENGS